MNTSVKNVVTTTALVVSHQFIAQHRWAGCPFEEQAFLRQWHRHVFHVRLMVGVGHDDREVEFFRLQQQLAGCCDLWRNRQVEMSCEMFAKQIVFRFLEAGYSVAMVEVSEDGENGAQVWTQNVHPPQWQTQALAVPDSLHVTRMF